MSALWQALQSPLVWAVLLFWLAYLLWLAGWIVLQKREPIATLSWLLSLAFLPVLGLLIYHLLGPQRIQRQRLKRSRFRTRLERSTAAANADAISPLQQLAQASGRYAPGHCDRVQLLVDGAATFDALVAAIAGARRHVHLEYYIFEPDLTGTRLRDALIERAAAGITVRLLMDALGSWRISEGFLTPLRAAGAEVAFVHRFRLRRLWRRKTNLRNHRKIVVVDGRIGFIGGVNITDEQNERVNANAYHDLHLRMDGEAVQWLQLAFVEDWAYVTSHAIKEPDLWPVLAPGPIRTQVLPAGPDSPWETIHRVQLAAIYQAQRRIWLATPYFVPGEAARMALTSAALRGVEVRILVPECSDSYLATMAGRSYFDELISAGAQVFEYPGMLHTKALLIDEDICILGSSNFDYRSFRLSFELCVMFEDTGVTEALAAILSRDFTAAKEVVRARELSFRARLAEAGARLLSPLL